MDKIKKRLFGNTGIEVSEIGFGAWPIGGSHYGDVPESDGIKAIETYIDAGGNHIDTARGYGKSEMLVGQVLNKLNRDSIFLASKTIKGDCLEGEVCLTHHLWSDLSQQIHLFLCGITLKDLVEKRDVQLVAMRQNSRMEKMLEEHRPLAVS